MKKLIAIFVVLALVAGASFAADVSGFFIGTANLAASDTAQNEDGDNMSTVDAGVKTVAARLIATGESGDGTFGGLVRADLTNPWFAGEVADVFAYGWWRPNEYLYFQLGRNWNSVFELNEITGWGFFGNAGDVGVAVKEWDGNTHVDGFGFYGGFDGFSAISITPFDGLAINVGIPFENGETIHHVYSGINAQVRYEIADIGRVAFTFVAGPGVQTIDEDKPTEIVFDGPASKLYLSFLLSAIENMSLNVGFAYTLPLVREDEVMGIKIKDTTNEPIEIGLGFSYDFSDMFGLRARLGLGIGGSVVGEVDGKSDTVETPMALHVDVLPYLNLGGLTIFLNVGMNYTAGYKVGDEENDPVVGWHVNPYVMVGLPWVGEFYAGIKISSVDSNKDEKDNAITTWSIPVGIMVSF